MTTAKIPDLAITYPDKIDNPIWVDGFFSVLWFDETITTTNAVYETTIDVPAFVDQLTVIGIGTFQLTNTSGADVLMSAGVTVDGERVSRNDHEAVNNQTQALVTAYGADLTGVAGSSVSVGLEVVISTGSNASNNGKIAGLLIGRR